MGKTPQALATTERVGADRILVITKKAKVLETVDTPGSWQKWATELDDFIQVPKKKPEFDSHRKEIYITNYESVYDHKKEGYLRPDILDFINASRHRAVCLILDESHCIKDPSSAQSKALKQLKLELKCRASDLHTYLLTGTPFTTGFIDVWNQLKFLGCPMTKTEFKDRFCKLGHIKGLLGWQQPIVGYKNVPQLYELVHQYAITMKSDEVVDLPPQLFFPIECPETELFISLTRERVSETALGQLKRIRDMKGLKPLPDDYKPYHVSKNIVLNPWCRNIDYPDTRWIADTPGLLWMRARQLSIGFQGNEECCVWYDKSRLERIEHFLAENPYNYVLFYNFVPEFYELFEMCERLGYHIDCYNGDVKSLYWYEKFAGQTEAEQLVNQKNIILANFASASTAMNWQLYSKCVIASLPLYKDWAQGLKRIHRIGSKEPVSYYVFIGDNWLDKGMWDALQSGTTYSQQMFNTEWNSVQL